MTERTGETGAETKRVQGVIFVSNEETTTEKLSEEDVVTFQDDLYSQIDESYQKGKTQQTSLVTVQS